MKKVEEFVAEYRQKDLTGKIVDMSPGDGKGLGGHYSYAQRSQNAIISRLQF